MLEKPIEAYVDGVTVGYVGSMTKEYQAEGIPFLRSLNIKPYKIDYTKMKYISKKFHEKIKKSLLSPGDVVIVRTGNPGTSAVIPNDLPEANCSDLVIIHPGKNVDPHYLVYYLNSSFGRNKIYGRLVGSVQNHFNVAEAKKLDFPFRPLSEQKYISQILFSFDHKSELLQKQNEILEKTIQTIFKSWFIDFDGHTEFVDSELGEIPKGWKVKKIEEICDTYGGGTPSTKNSEYWNGDIKWAIPSDLTKSNTTFLYESERKITQKGLENCASKLHPKNSILMTSRATLGYFAVNLVPIATNQGFIIIEPKKFNELYYLLNNFQDRVSEFIGKATGTIFLEISRGIFRKLPILIPPEKPLNDFHNKVESTYNMISKNEKQIQNLKIMRDSLLPKLISGKIRV